MAPFIMKIKFYTHGKKNAAHAKYIATRPGAEKEVSEISPESALGHIKYAAERPRSHGLFGPDNPPELADIQNELKNHEGIVWRVILSLQEEDAKRLGYINRKEWELALRSAVPEAAAKMGIPESNLRWTAAFHQEKGHPHVHLMIWENEPKRNRGVISKGERVDIKKCFIQQIYSAERSRLCAEKTAMRDIVRDLAKDTLKDIQNTQNEIQVLEGASAGVPPRLYDDDRLELAKKLEQLSNIMPGKGRVALKYMPPDVKTKALEAADWLINQPGFAASTVRYQQIARELAGHYTTQDDSLEKAEQNAYNDLKERVAQIILKSASQLQEKIKDGAVTEAQAIDSTVLDLFDQGESGEKEVVTEVKVFKLQPSNPDKITTKLLNNTGRISSRAIYKADPENDRRILAISNEVKREITAKLKDLVEKIPEDVMGRPPLAVLQDEAKILAREISDYILQQNGAGVKYQDLILKTQGEEIVGQKYQQLKERVAEQVVVHAMLLRPQEIPDIEMMAHHGRVLDALDKLQFTTGNYIIDDKEEAAWTTGTMYRSFVLLGQDEQTAKEITVKWAQSAGVEEPDKIISSEIKRMQKISEKCKEEDKPEPVHVSRSDWEHMRDNLGLDEEELLHPWFGIVQMGQQLNKFSEVIQENVEPVIQGFQQATSYPQDYKEINWTVRNMTQTLKALDVRETEREQIVRGWVQRSGVEISEPRLRDILDRIELADNKYSLNQENWERLNKNLGISNSSELPWRNSIAEKLWWSSGNETSRLIYKTDFEADRSILPISNELKSYITQNLHDLAEKIPEDIIGRPPLGALPDDVKTQAREIADHIIQHNGGGNRYWQLLLDQQGENVARHKTHLLRDRIAEKVVAHSMELLPREIPEIEMRAHEGRVQEAIFELQNVTGDFIKDNQDEAEWTAGTMYRSMLRMGVNKESAQNIVISWSQSAGVKEPKTVLDNTERYMDFIAQRCEKEGKPEPIHVSRSDWEHMRDNLGLEEEELLHPWFGIKQDIDSDKETSSQNIEYPKPEIIQDNIQPFINSIELASASPLDHKELNWTMRAMVQTLYALDVKEADRERIIRGWVQRADVKISEARLRDLLDRTEIAGRKEYFLGRDNWQRLNQNLGIDSPSSLPWKFEGLSMSMTGKLWKSVWRAVECERSKAEAQMQMEKRAQELQRQAQHAQEERKSDRGR